MTKNIINTIQKVPTVKIRVGKKYKSSSKIFTNFCNISRNHNYQSEKDAFFLRLQVFLTFFPFFHCSIKCRISLLWSCTLTDPWYKVARAPDEVQWVGSGNLLLIFVNIFFMWKSSLRIIPETISLHLYLSSRFISCVFFRCQQFFWMLKKPLELIRRYFPYPFSLLWYFPDLHRVYFPKISFATPKPPQSPPPPPQASPPPTLPQCSGWTAHEPSPLQSFHHIFEDINIAIWSHKL